jgi:hypothetical protein
MLALTSVSCIEGWNTCAVSVVPSTAYGVLDLPHHGEFTSYSLGWVYYTRNMGFPQNNLVAIKMEKTGD